MPLATMRALLQKAAQNNCAVGAFGVANLEMIQGAVNAAEMTGTPIIIQIAEIRLPYSPLYLIGPAMIAAARHAKVDVAVHLDHGTTLPCIREAIDLGFTSVMFDGSALPLEENIDKTNEIIALARPGNVTVEAELGRIGRTEDGLPSPVAYTDPQEALYFLRETGVDALAVGIGNAHGVYEGTPDLHFDVLEQISKENDTPLVLHGGTGLSDSDFQTCIRGGVRKINIASAFFNACAQAVGFDPDIFMMSHSMIEASQKTALEYMHHFRPIREGE